MKECDVCGGKLVNIEWSHSNYISLVCVNKKCDEYGKVVSHKAK